jgi:hypothetical protein
MFMLSFLYVASTSSEAVYTFYFVSNFVCDFMSAVDFTMLQTNNYWSVFVIVYRIFGNNILPKIRRPLTQENMLFLDPKG